MRKIKKSLSLIFLLLLTPSAYPQDWQLECIDSTMGPSHHRRMILDQQNLPHIFFFSLDTGHLMQFYKTDSGWDLVDYGILFIPQGLDIGPEGSFHLTQGGENVVYYMFTNQDTTYIDTIYVGIAPYLTSRVRIDNSGIPHIIAGTYFTGQIFHIMREDSAWQVEQVLTFFPYLVELSMRIDIFDNIHLAMVGNIPGAVGYAHDNPDWFHLVLSDSSINGNINMDLEANQRPAITFNYNSPGGGTKQGFLEFNGSSWDTTFFDTTFGGTEALPFAYGTDNTPHLILYIGGYPPEDRAMIHAFRVQDSWLYDTLAVGPFMPHGLGADSQSSLHLHYSRTDNRGFYYGIKDLSTGTHDYPVSVNRDFEVLNSYPNPFNASTVIRYSLSQPSDVKIDIHDILGRRVETLIQEEQQAGNHQVMWDAENASSGMYFYRIQAADHSETRKMMLLR